MKRTAVLCAALAFAACHTIPVAALRPGFATDAPLEFKCVKERLDDINEIAQPLYRQGWRLIAISAERTAFLGFSSEEPILCFERSNIAANSAPLTEQPKQPPPPPSVPVVPFMFPPQ